MYRAFVYFNKKNDKLFPFYSCNTWINPGFDNSFKIGLRNVLRRRIKDSIFWNI